MADLLRERGERMQWYRDELLHMAKELGHRLLPAFNTTSGLPYPKVFLLSAFSHSALCHCSSFNSSSSLQTSQTCKKLSDGTRNVFQQLSLFLGGSNLSWKVAIITVVVFLVG